MHHIPNALLAGGTNGPAKVDERARYGMIRKLDTMCVCSRKMLIDENASLRGGDDAVNPQAGLAVYTVYVAVGALATWSPM